MRAFLLINLLFSINFLDAKTDIHHSSPLKTINIQHLIQTLIIRSKQGDPKAQYSLATRYRDGKGVNVDFKKAFNLYHLSALKNFPPSQYQLGMMFRHGLGVKNNHELARYWLRKAARSQYPQARDIFRAFYSKKPQIKQYRFASN